MSVLVRPNQIRVAAGISVHLYTNRWISFKSRIKNAACSPCKSHLSGNYLATLSLQMTKLASKLLHFKDFYWELFRTEVHPGLSQPGFWALPDVFSCPNNLSLVNKTDYSWEQDNYIQSLILLTETTPFQFKMIVLILFPLKCSKRKLISSSLDEILHVRVCLALAINQHTFHVSWQRRERRSVCQKGEGDLSTISFAG